MARTVHGAESTRSEKSEKFGMSVIRTQCDLERAMGAIALPRLDERRRNEHLAADEAVTRFPSRAGHRLTLLRDGPETYDAMFAAFERAQTYIHVLSYAFNHGVVGRRFADSLVRARRRGVSVRLLYDWMGSVDCSSSYFRALSQERSDTSGSSATPSPHAWARRDQPPQPSQDRDHRWPRRFRRGCKRHGELPADLSSVTQTQTSAHKTQPSGDSGDPIACGVIVADGDAEVRPESQAALPPAGASNAGG